MMMGPTLPCLGIVGAAMVGARALNEQNMVSKMEYVTEGEFKNQIRVTVNKSPFVSTTLIMNPKHTKSLCALGQDDLGEDDAEGNILHATEYYDETTGQKCKDGMFRVPADAHRDKITLEWIFAIKEEESETDALFNDQILKRHGELAATGGLTGLRAFTAKNTGYADVGDEEEISLLLASGQTDATLMAMRDAYGQENLEKMTSSEFYRLYKDYSLITSK